MSCKISFSDHVYNFRNIFSDPETIRKYTLTMPWCLNLCFMPFSSEIFNPENDWLPQNGYLQSKNEFGYENKRNTIKIAAEITSLAIIAVIS